MFTPKLLLAFGLLSLLAPVAPADPLTRDFFSADSIQWGDGRPFVTPVNKEGPYPQGYKADFVFNVPADNWYEVVYTGNCLSMRHDLLVDGKYAWKYRTTSTISPDTKVSKGGNLWLTAGKHTIRIQRLGRTGFPIQVPSSIELRPSTGQPETTITADKTLVDMVRAGEKLEIKVTDGGPHAATYEMLSHDLLDPQAAPKVVGEIDAPKSATPVTHVVDVPCPTEGAYQLTARVKGGKDLLPSEFPIGYYGVVDVKKVAPGTGELKTVYTIDCVNQTINGAPLPAGSFLECNGPTRVVTTTTGTYRESHDCTPPGADVAIASDDPHSYSGFSYRVDLPDLQKPYLIDVEFPDDDRRSVTINQLWINDKTGGFASGTSYSAKSYETGGMQPLSFQMQHQHAIVWAASKQLILGILSQQVGHRAAAARITIREFTDGLVPVAKMPVKGGRTFNHWYEEADNWRYLVNIASKYPPGLVHDMVGLERWVRLCRYFGVNGISACGLGYQTAFWRASTIEGYDEPAYDQSRLIALLCEKYGMAYTPEVYATQGYLNSVTLPALADKPDDVRAVSCQGALIGPAASPCDLNPLHPVVQKMWIDALGELADKLRDSPAFRGITVRADAWNFNGEYTFASLNWGYSDWTIKQFEKDTGTQVPGADGDSGRFIQRFEFLTSATMRDKWIAWRCARILDYHKRIRDRIAGDRSGLFFGVVGDFRCDPSFQLPDSLTERMLGCGIDLKLIQGERGLAVIPYARYGFRNLGVQSQRIFDDFLDPDNVDAGMGGIRAFSAYMNYQELANAWPAEKLGVTVTARKAPYYCSAALAAGQGSLEKFAVVLAEQDTSFFRDGGNTDIYGEPAAWNAWFSEYEALPALPFTPLPEARDPVAVWYRDIRQKDGYAPGLYFYVVNREQYPVKIDLSLKESGAITQLGTGAHADTDNGRLTIQLQPYELRAYRAASGAAIASVTTTVPPAQIDYVRQRLAAAQDIAKEIAGPRSHDISDDERAAFNHQLAAAWDAYQQGHYWRARTAVSMAPALQVYEDLAELPPGQMVTSFPEMLVGRPREGHWLPRRPVLIGDDLKALLPSGSTSTFTPSQQINSNWNGAQVLMSSNGALNLDIDVPADGVYSLKLGHIASTPGVMVATLNGVSLSVPVVTKNVDEPETVAFPTVDLKSGKAHLVLQRSGDFGIYAAQFLPKLKPMPNPAWSTLGPFKTVWGQEGAGRTESADAIAKGLATPYIDEFKIDLGGTYKNEYGKELHWTQKHDSSMGDQNDLVIAMPNRTGSSKYDLNYAVTYIHSDRDRQALIYLACDWWANAYLNGARLHSNISDSFRADSGGADFASWYPYVAVLDLKKGTNELLVKQHGGSTGSNIAAYITDDPAIRCTPKPNDDTLHAEK